MRFAVFLCILLVALPAAAQQRQRVSQQQLDVPAELQAPMAALLRLSTGLETDKTCKHMTVPQKQLYTAQMTQAVGTLHMKLQQSGVNALKSERILRDLMTNGEKMAQSNFPTCTNLATDIIVKAMQDAECINPYLAGTNTACFR
jgi:hypothetical protein